MPAKSYLISLSTLYNGIILVNIIIEPWLNICMCPGVSIPHRKDDCICNINENPLIPVIYTQPCLLQGDQCCTAAMYPGNVGGIKHLTTYSIGIAPRSMFCTLCKQDTDGRGGGEQYVHKFKKMKIVGLKTIKFTTK